MECVIQEAARLQNALALYHRAMQEVRGLADHDCPEGIAESVIQSADPGLQEALIFVGATFFRFANHPTVFDQMARARLSREEAMALAVTWFQLPRRKEAMGARLPSFIPEHHGDETEREVLLQVLTGAPDESDAYVDAARLLLGRCRSSEAIAQFRQAWAALTPERREAIALGLHYQTWDEMAASAGGLSGPDIPSRLELLAGERALPMGAGRRLRWVDRIAPGLRALVWEAFSDGTAYFACQGSEPGSQEDYPALLLDQAFAILRDRAPLLEEVLASAADGSGRLAINRFIFKTRGKEKRRPDLALAFVCHRDQGPAIARHLVLWSGVLESGLVRVGAKEVAGMLKTSAHGAHFMAWEPGHSPRCVPALILRDCLDDQRKFGLKLLATPKLQWGQVDLFADRLEDLIGDRLLCAEVGDPAPDVWGLDGPGIAAGLAQAYGPPRHGVLVIELEMGLARKTSSVEVGDGPQLIALA